jgi:glutathione-regulated potassium-efflux system ancillary protein KefG
MPSRVLIIFAHPALEKSRVNRYLARAVEGMPEVTFHDLYEEYPDFQIDVKGEQELLVAHDVIVFQHPFYWYSCPALLKEWLDLVLEHGFAYGRDGTALAGKVLLNAVTTGGPQDAYRPEGYNRFTMRQLLAPFDQTAHLCGMRYLAPFVVHRSLLVSTAEDAAPHARAWHAAVTALADGTLDWEAAAGAERLNDVITVDEDAPSSSSSPFPSDGA